MDERGISFELNLRKDYYGKVLRSSQDLKTSACCEGGGLPADLVPLLNNVHEEPTLEEDGFVLWESPAILKNLYDTLVAEASKLGEMYAAVARDAYKPVEKAVTKRAS